MTEVQKQLKWGSEELEEEMKSEYFSFENKKRYRVEVDTKVPIESKVFEFEDKEVQKYIVQVIIDGVRHKWACSKSVMKKILDDIDETNTFDVMLDEKEKRYSILPVKE